MSNMNANILLSIYSKYFPEEQMMAVKEIFENLNEEDQTMLAMAQFKSPTTALIISLLGGGFGIDRFYIGDTSLGILKLITCGGFGLWAIIDLFLIMNATREKNFQKLLSLVHC